MKRKTDSDAHRHFVTGVSMITSRGSQGKNVMAVEWTMQISYDPMLIAIFIHEGSSTLKNISETREFGVNVASETQAVSVSTAGGYSRLEIDKLGINDVFEILKPKKIKTPLIAGSIINAECKAIMKKRIGDHIMIVGKVVALRYDESKKPLVYHKSRYFSIDTMVEPDRQKIRISSTLFDFFASQSKGKFVFKCVGILVRTQSKMLVMKLSNTTYIVPVTEAPNKKDYRDHLQKFLNELQMEFAIGTTPHLKRLVLLNGKRIQRVNFILFEGKSKKYSSNFSWKPIKENKLLRALD